MKIISSLTDLVVLGLKGTSNSTPRYTARAILKRTDGLYAVMFSEKFSLYSLPGGGIEGNENKIEALKRELIEETGCLCENIYDIGCVYENRNHCNFTQYSYYYFVTTTGQTENIQLTDSEKVNKTCVQWLEFDDLYNHITQPVHNTNQQKFIQAKDTAALNEFLKIFEK